MLSQSQTLQRNPYSELTLCHVLPKTLATAWKKADKLNPLFSCKKGLLYTEGTLEEVEDVEQLVLPVQYRETALQTAHSSPMAGHFGRKKTTARLRTRFLWPKMSYDIKDLCKTCPTCQRTATRQAPHYPLVPPIFFQRRNCIPTEGQTSAVSS